LEQTIGFLISAREREIARLVARELSDKEIAKRLEISHCTVRFHLKNIQQKLGVAGRVGIAVWVVEQGLHRLQ
jgi:DNA-binding CsgD family transcriptional regulator